MTILTSGLFERCSTSGAATIPDPSNKTVFFSGDASFFRRKPSKFLWLAVKESPSVMKALRKDEESSFIGELGG
jgi:hypothetical protein